MCYLACPIKHVMHNRYKCKRGWRNVQRQCCSVNIPTKNIADLDSQDLTLLWMLTLQYILTFHFTQLWKIILCSFFKQVLSYYFSKKCLVFFLRNKSTQIISFVTLLQTTTKYLSLSLWLFYLNIGRIQGVP